MMFRQALSISAFIVVAGILPAPSLAQHQLLDDRWQQLETPHFSILSQVSGNRTERFAQDLEYWRAVASHFMSDGEMFPPAAVKNQVFLFENLAKFQAFAVANETAFFYSTPRRNFMAVVLDDESSLVQARHHYAHFLTRNFTDLRIPRWYEEGLAAYLSNLSINRNVVELVPYTQQAFEGSLMASQEVTLDELLFKEEALGSPRLLQRANFKSETFLHFLLHGHEEQGFTDRREELKHYIELSLAGRTQRFAMDQAFSVTVAQLEAEYERYLEESVRPRVQLNLSGMREVNETEPFETLPVGFIDLSNALGELAIHTGKFELAEIFFQAAIDRNSTVPRSYSGLADSLRMQEHNDVSDVEITAFYQQALNLGSQEPIILLDYGEYLETVLNNCELVLNQQYRSSTQDEIKALFRKSIELAPDNPEANLAMGQYYLFSGRDYTAGIPFQIRALQLLPADSFIMEQTIRYKIEAGEYSEAERLINELAQPMHYWREFDWVTDLRRRMQFKQQGVEYDSCEHSLNANVAK